MLNIDRGSIFFDEFIKRMDDKIKQDEIDNEKENKKFKEFLKNNKAGQEIFDEMDRELANAKRMIRVKVKKDPQPNKIKTRSKDNSR